MKVKVEIRGKIYDCLILKTHPAGTLDVQIISSGLCFRVSGLQVRS